MMWENWNPHLPLVGMENGSAPLENRLADLKQSYSTHQQFSFLQV